MQHGTGREWVRDLIENAHAITTQHEVRSALQRALLALDESTDLDEPGVFGPDYPTPRVTKAERAEAVGVAGTLSVSGTSETTVGKVTR